MRWGAVIGAAILLFSCSRSVPVPKCEPLEVDYAVSATLEEDMETGCFQLKLTSQKPAEVFYELIDQDGNVLADALYRVDSTTVTVPDHIRNVRQWTAETPELYTLHLQEGGRSSYHPVVFRQIMPYSQDVYLVNGCQVAFKGANISGREPRETLQALKKAGVNALNAAARSRALQELCDSAGLYLYPQPDSLERPDSRSAAVRHAWQDISIQAVDLQNGVFRIENRRQFTSIEDYTLRWWVERNGKRIRQPFGCTLHFATDPGTAEEFAIKLPSFKKPGEYRLFFEAVTRENRPLVEKETVMATESFLLQEGPAPDWFKPGGPLTVTEGDTRLVIRGKDVEMVYDRADGTVRSLIVKNREWLPNGLTPVLPEAGKALCSWNMQGDSLVLHARYLLSQEERQARFILLGSGVLKVDSPDISFRLQAPGSGLRYFGQAPDLTPEPAFKTIRTTAGEAGLHTDISWLETEAFTLEGTSPFSFQITQNQLIINPEPDFILVPRH